MFVFNIGPTYKRCSECKNRKPMSRMRGDVCYNCYEPINVSPKPTAEIPYDDYISNNVDFDFKPEHFSINISFETYDEYSTNVYDKVISFESKEIAELKDEYDILEFFKRPEPFLTAMGLMDVPDDQYESRLTYSPFSIFIYFEPEFPCVGYFPENKMEELAVAGIESENEFANPMDDYTEKVDVQSERIELHVRDPLDYMKENKTERTYEENGFIVNKEIKGRRFSQDKFRDDVKNNLKKATFINQDKIDEFCELIYDEFNKELEKLSIL